MSLTFLKAHYMLFFVSVVFGILLLPLLEIASDKILKYKNFFNFKSVKITFFLGVILFLIFGYFTKPVYYNPKTIGTIGDDYFQLAEVQKKNGALQAQHVFKPYITEKVTIFIEKMGFLDVNDDLYLEKAVIKASLPIRVLNIVGLLAIFFAVFLYFNSFYIGLISFLYIGTSFSVWAFGIMHNSIGAAIAMTMLTYFCAIYFLKKQSYIRAFLLGIMAGLCVFTHSAVGYFCLGIFLSMFYWVLSDNEVCKKLKFKYFLVFCAGSGLIALLYYYVLASYFGTWNIVNLINYISDRGYKTNILSITSLKKLYSSIMQYSLNLFNVWQPKNIWENFLIFLQISGITSAFILTFKNIRRDNFKKNVNFLLFFLFPFFSVILGFLFLRYEYYHYLDVGNLSILLFLLYFLFLFAADDKNRIKIGVSLSLVIISFFAYNAMSSHNIFKYRDINSISIYSNYEVIYNHLKTIQKEKAVFLTYDEYQPYFYKGLQAYYKKFDNIERSVDFSKNKLEFNEYLRQIFFNDTAVFIDMHILDKVKNLINYDEFVLTHINSRVLLVTKRIS